MSKLRELQRRTCKLEMTPMIDVTFLLLVFFMCTLQFKTLEGKLAATLPRDVGLGTQETTPLERIDLRIQVVEPGRRVALDGGPWAGTGPFRFDGSRVIRYAVGARRAPSLLALEARVRALRAQDPERGVTIDARPGVVYGEVVSVLDTLLGLGIQDVTFVGYRD